MWGKRVTYLQFSLYKCSFRIVLRHTDSVLRNDGTRVELSWKQKFQLPLIFQLCLILHFLKTLLVKIKVLIDSIRDYHCLALENKQFGQELYSFSYQFLFLYTLY